MGLDFKVDIVGPHNVFVGHVAHLEVKSLLTEGEDLDNILLSNLELDIPNAEIQYWINITRYDNIPNKKVGFGSFGIRISTSKDTPLGRYPFKLTLTGQDPEGNNVNKTVEFEFGVLELPQPLVATKFPPNKPLDSIEQWEKNMIEKGSYHMTRPIGCCGDFGGVWYYDGARAYLQMADWLDNKEFETFAYQIFDIYGPYVAKTGGQGFARYPHGLRMVKHRDATSPRAEIAQKAIEKLAEIPSPGWRPYWSVDALQSSRDPSYGISCHVISQEEGVAPKPFLLREHIGVMLGYYDQWFVTKNVLYVYPFLVGLWAEAMIDYYEYTKDPIIPPLLKIAADYCWENEWDSVSESWWLVGGYTPETVFRQPAPDLNMMFVPLYGFVFQHTGDVKYRDIGDLAFTSGTKRAYLDKGKQFIQNYRWSFKYLEWRKSPEGSDDEVDPRLLDLHFTLEGALNKVEDLINN